jgi:hypothetical protein
MTSPATPAPIPRFHLLFAVALLVRAGTVGLGVWLSTFHPYQPPDDPAAVTLRERILNGSARVIEPWYRWDAVWIANVATNGYSGATDRGGRLGVAFLPAMPATIAAADALGLNGFVVGLLVANLAGAVGGAVLARLAARELSDPAAAWRTLALVLAFPTALFFSAPYNESFGLLFGALALAAWQTNRPLAAGAAAFGVSLARLTGGAIGLAAGVDWLATRTRATLPRAACVVVGSFAGVIFYLGFLWWSVGDPFAVLKVQGMWGRESFSWKNPFRTIESIYDPNMPHFGEAVVVLGVIVLGLRSWRKRGPFWGLVTLVPVAQMFATGTLLSAHRVVLACVPAFVELADLLRGRRLALVLALLVFGYAQLLLLQRFVCWQFAG